MTANAFLKQIKLANLQKQNKEILHYIKKTDRNLED